MVASAISSLHRHHCIGIALSILLIKLWELRLNRGDSLFERRVGKKQSMKKILTKIEIRKAEWMNKEENVIKKDLIMYS